MTPAKPGWTPSQGPGLSNIMYANKVTAMANLIKQKIPGVQVRIVPYRRLVYRYDGPDRRIGPDADIANTNARGMAIFQ